MDIIATLGIWFFGAAFTFGYLSVRDPDEEVVHILLISIVWPVILLGVIPGMLGAVFADTLKRRGGK